MNWFCAWSYDSHLLEDLKHTDFIHFKPLLLGKTRNLQPNKTCCLPHRQASSTPKSIKRFFFPPIQYQTKGASCRLGSLRSLKHAPAQPRPKPSLFFFEHTLARLFLQTHRETHQRSNSHRSRAFLFLMYTHLSLHNHIFQPSHSSHPQQPLG